MRKKRLKTMALCAGRGVSLAAFCLALTLVVLPVSDQTVAASGQTAVTVESGQQPLTALPQPGDKLIPLGRTTGIKLFSKGTMVVGFSDLESTGTCPAKAGGLKEGDVLLALNGHEITGNEMLTALLSALPDENAVFTVLRDGQEMTVKVKAVYDQSLDCHRIGAWIRDSVAGIGTITFVDPETGVFGALGHGICDADTGQLVTFGAGSVMPSSVTNVQKSQKGTPGQLCGQFDLIHDQGWLVSNCDSGIYGMLTEDDLYENRDALQVGRREDVREGPATILSNVEGIETEEYDVRILKIYGGGQGRELLLEVTDPDLLAVTGGIVQGMSGSPIIQDGKLVGAVTHVLVNDPTRGYGIFIENMLDAAG
jgi:stage IV sporulation protein B